MPNYTVTVSDESVKGWMWKFDNKGAIVIQEINKMLDNMGLSYLKESDLKRRKEIIRELEKADPAKQVAIYEIAKKLAINPTAFVADVDRIYAEELAKQEPTEEPII